LTPWGESVIEYILYLLWDLGFKVGHSTRNVDQCIRLANTDFTVRTAILEARFLWGEAALFDELERRFDHEVVARTGDAFVEAKLTERDARHVRAGTSRYLVEPNVKEGKGGLRDLHSLFWIGKFYYRTHKVADLVAAGVFSNAELMTFAKAEDFLWAVRCHLHFCAGRAEERLTFDRQQELAQRLGYVARAGQRGVERFMKHYFLVAKGVGDLTRIFLAVLEAREIKRPPVLARVLGRFGLKAGKTLEHGFTIEFGRLNVTSAQVFADDPVNLIRLFHIAAEHNVLLHPVMVRLVTRSLRLIDVQLRGDTEANKLFLDILTSPSNPESVLRKMNETGVLGRFVPDFGAIVCAMQFSMYHHYTVDEHLLRTIGILSDIEHGRLGDDHPLAHEIINDLENRRALYVAALLHDIAKGREGHHSVIGAQIARELGPRLGLSAGETETAAWLVEQHLVMSNIAQTRDLFDPKTISDFAELVQSPERLKLLLILTVVDIRAVGPGVWNGWKGELLRTLYHETEPMLAGGHTAAGRGARADQAREKFKAAAGKGWDGQSLDAHASRLGDPYWLSTEPILQQAHASLMRDAANEGASFKASSLTDRFRGSTHLIVFTPDHPRLLAMIAGACSLVGTHIVSAQIFTTADGMALDTITLKRNFDNDADETRRAKAVAATIERALAGEIYLLKELAGKRRRGRSKAFWVAPQVMITNSLSDHSTVIEINGLDRPGLLFDVTETLYSLNLNIRSAHITTYGERAVDVFYVRDLFGHRITAKARQEAIRTALLDALDAGQEGERVAKIPLANGEPPAGPPAVPPAVPKERAQ
ncbi:MAG: [protein-PII] uridylyltransferase, partial [Alphaproteobacteria bacterium]